MNRNDLYRAVGAVGDDMLERSEKRKARIRGMRITAAAAAGILCVGAAGLWMTLKENTPDAPGASPEASAAQISNSAVYGADVGTSAEYNSLEELLEHLSTNDYHFAAAAEGRGGAAQSTGTAAITEGAYAAAYGGYSYYADIDGIRIAALDGSDGEGKISIESDTPTEHLFVNGSRLVTVDGIVEYIGEHETEEDWHTVVRIYDISKPQSPKQENEFIQQGELTDCWMGGGELVLLTSDGVCACGWSRLDDTAAYVPGLTVNGQRIEWDEEEISILGEPTSVQYTAAAKIDVAAGRVTDKHAFYGDIKEVFYGGGWLAMKTLSSTASMQTHPEIYTFDTEKTIEYTGRISLADMFGLAPAAEVKDFVLSDGVYPSAISVMRAGEAYRIIGGLSERGDDDRTALMAAEADMETGKCRIGLLDAAEAEGAWSIYYDDLIWEEDRAAACVQLTYREGADYRFENRFAFMDFSDEQISVTLSDMTAERVTGIDTMYGMGDPFGTIKSMIPMGNGIYLRYNGRPDGLDIYDFSDTAAPVRIYDSAGSLGSARFEFFWKVYAEDVFGMMKVTPDGEDYFNASYSWQVYAVDAGESEPYTLLAEYPLGSQRPEYTAEFMRFEAFEYEGKHYIIGEGTGPVAIEW